jgi:hypothetical protein
MKYIHMDKAITESEDHIEWKEVVLMPFFHGIAFGVGCYLAKLILNLPVMEDIMDMAERCARTKAKV